MPRSLFVWCSFAQRGRKPTVSPNLSPVRRPSKAESPRDRCCTYLVLRPDDLCRALANDHTRRHGVAGRHAWHDRSIRDAKIVEAVDFEIAIHHTHPMPPHFCRGCLMPKAKRAFADVVFYFCPFRAARQDLSLDKTM